MRKLPAKISFWVLGNQWLLYEREAGFKPIEQEDVVATLYYELLHQ